MSVDVYNLLTTILAGVLLISLIGSICFLVGAFVGWRTPFRKRRLICCAVLFAASIGSIVAQQTLLFKVLLPSLGRAALAARQQSEGETSLTKVGDVAPGFSIVTDSGSTFDLGRLRGKLVLLTFFATWCGPCIAELPHVQKLWDEFGGRDDFAMLVVGREESNASIAAFKSKNGFSFPTAADPARAVYGRYATQSIPRTYLISREGTIVFQCTGFYEDEFAKLKQLIAAESKTSK